MTWIVRCTAWPMQIGDRVSTPRGAGRIRAIHKVDQLQRGRAPKRSAWIVVDLEEDQHDGATVTTFRPADVKPIEEEAR